MSVDYAAGLSHCDDLGICGLDEVFDKPDSIRDKVSQLAEWMRHANGSCVVHVGAGLSTAAGIRDFRGKRGVWTEMQAKDQSSASAPRAGDEIKVESDNETKIKPFDETTPTRSHMALKELCQLGLIGHMISQNVDGLFLKANLDRKYISELHGNFYLDECTRCKSRFIRQTASATMRLQKSTVKCPRNHDRTMMGAADGPSTPTNPASTCKGYLRDTILDWESPIPHNELRVATRESKRNKLHICIGTSLQLSPSKDLVCKPNKTNKLVVINLQPTKFDSKADMVIHGYADEVMKELAQQLKFDIPTYEPEEDPTKRPDLIGSMWRK